MNREAGLQGQVIAQGFAGCLGSAVLGETPLGLVQKDRGREQHAQRHRAARLGRRCSAHHGGKAMHVEGAVPIEQGRIPNAGQALGDRRRGEVVEMRETRVSQGRRLRSGQGLARVELGCAGKKPGRRGLVADALTQIYPDADHQTLAQAVWALAHGLAFLHLDGKFSAATDDEVAERVRAAFFGIRALGAATT